MKNMMRSAKLALLLTTIVALSSCQADSASQDSVYGELEELDPSRALVVYWHTLTGDAEGHLLEMIDDFNASNEWNVTVAAEYQGDSETIQRRVLDNVSSGKLPSLVMSEPGLAATLAAHEAAVALSPYWKSARWGWSDDELVDFIPGALATDRLPQFDGERFSFSSCRALQVLYYNVDWLKELGHEAPPQTWDEFREMACTASSPDEDLYGLEFGMDSSLFINMLAGQDVAIINPDVSAYTLGGEQGRSTLRFLQDLIQDRCAQWETETGPLGNFGAGKILFSIASSADLLAYQHSIVKGANFAWSLAVLPHTTERARVGVYGSSMTILPNHPREQLAAWLFIKWLAEPEQQARWAQEVGCFPTSRSALAAVKENMAQYPQYDLASQFLAQQWINEPAVTAFAVCRAEIARMIYAVTAGEDVNQWLADTRSLCNQALDDATQ
jgi:ABC-type glycerol-3-phosphate transport system substrate-binding protein